MKSCPVCGKTFPAGNFCEDCGIMLVDAQPAPEVRDPDPIDYTQNYPENSPAPVQKKSGNSNKIIIAVLAVLLVAAIAVAAFFIVRSMNKNDIGTDNNNNNDAYYETTEQSQAVIETTPLLPETTTIAPPTTTTEPEIEANVSDAYEAFDDFYISYLNAINSFDPSLMTNCSPQIRSEMAERFDINKKSLFDLRRIDFDEDSLYVNSRGGYTEYTFYAKCVTMLYDRSTLEQKDLNYSCWKVTVEYENNTYTITAMERDSDYKMSNNVVTISDNEELF